MTLDKDRKSKIELSFKKIYAIESNVVNLKASGFRLPSRFKYRLGSIPDRPLPVTTKLCCVINELEK